MFEYKIIKSKRKTLSIEISIEKEIKIRCPKHISNKQIQKFLEDKKNWINKTFTKIDKIKKEKNTPKNHILFLGEKYEIKFSKKIDNIKFQKNCIVINPSFKDNIHNIIQPKLISIARNLIYSRTKKIALNNNLKFRKFNLTKAKTMWGNCNYYNDIRINWRLIMAPVDVLDYVIIHELCHTKIKAHNKDFWDMVNLLCPYYKKHKSYLKEQGATLCI